MFTYPAVFTCPMTHAPVAPNCPYPLPYGSTTSLCYDYAGQVTSLSTLTRVLGVTIPDPARPTTLEEERAQEDTYRGIINHLMVNYLTDPRTTPELPIAHIRTVILKQDMAIQYGPFAREKYTVVTDPTILHAIAAFTSNDLDLPRAMMADWADLYCTSKNTTTADDVLTPTYLESVEEGWVADPTMVTYDNLNWDILPREAFALYGYSV